MGLEWDVDFRNGIVVKLSIVFQESKSNSHFCNLASVCFVIKCFST